MNLANNPISWAKNPTRTWLHYQQNINLSKSHFYLCRLCKKTKFHSVLNSLYNNFSLFALLSLHTHSIFISRMKSQNPNSTYSDLKALISMARTRPTKLFAYGFVCSLVACTAFLAFNPSSNASSPWFDNVFSSSSASSFKASVAPYQSQVPSLVSHFLPNSSSSIVDEVDRGNGSSKDAVFGLKEKQTQIGFWSAENEVFNNNSTKNESGSDDEDVSDKSAVGWKDQTMNVTGSQGSGVKEQKQGNSDFEIEKGEVSNENQTATGSQGSGVTERKQGNSEVEIKKDEVSESKNQTNSRSESQGIGVSNANQTATTRGESKAKSTSSIDRKNETAQVSSNENSGKKREKWIEDMIGCDIFDGHWVKDESYPLYPEGSCSNVGESFNCYLNGRPDRSYQKLRWQPTGCNIPRFNGTDMLERLRGKQLVLVGDSLNRNMFESLVCILKNSVEDKSKAFEVSGRREYRSRGSYSYLFTVYSCL